MDASKIWRRLQSHCKVDYCPRNPLSITIETSPVGLETVINNLVSAALRAAADQVVPEESEPSEQPFADPNDPWPTWHANKKTRRELLAIADELETL
jgi:hypothetical protein